jgi:hypothetical protein
MRRVREPANGRAKRTLRLLQWATLAGLVAGCHAMAARDREPLTPTATCGRCCSQTLDACLMTDGAAVSATTTADGRASIVCPEAYRECTVACDSGDENEICVVQTNRALASSRPKPLLVSPAPPPAPKLAGECDQKGTWTLEVAHTEGRAKGCAELAAIPKTVRFRVGRRSDAYVLYDLAATQGWSDAFSVENHANECVVTLRRDNRTKPDAPRTLALKLQEHDHAVSGTLSYEEANRPDGCALEAPIAGRVVPPPLVRPAAPPYWPPPPPPPIKTAHGMTRVR